MDTGELLQQFVGMTGADTDFALSFLMVPFHLFTCSCSNKLVKANDWNLESAINLYLEGNYGATGGNATPNKESAGVGSGSGNAGIVNEQGGGEPFDTRTLVDEEIARYLYIITAYERSSHY